MNASYFWTNMDTIVWLNHHFLNAKRMSEFVRDYMYVNGKSLKMGNGGGNSKIFLCTDKGCKRKIVGKRVNRYTDNTWKISYMNDAHIQDCSSVPVASARQLSEMPVFSTAIMSNRTQSMKSTMDMVRQANMIYINEKKEVRYAR